VRLASRSLSLPERVGLGLDRALAIVAPVWARRRLVARAQLHVIHRAISAGRPDRTSAIRQPSKAGPVEKSRKELVPTRAQARELYRLNPYARGVVNSIVANLIGCGIRPQARVMKPKLKSPDEDFNDLAEEEWKFWTDTSGPSGQENYYEQQRLIQRELLVPGEVLLHFTTPGDGRRVPFAVEVLPAERLADHLDEQRKDGTRIIQGIEFDASGKRVAYWLYKNHPGDSYRLADKPQRVPAESVRHLYEELEPGQVRGITRFLTCAGAFEAVLQLLDFSLTRARIASAFALMITDDGTGIRLVKTGDESDDEDEDENELAHFEGGMLFRGKPGQDLKHAGPAIQDTNLEAFMTVILRMIGRGLDVAYELVSRDLSKVTYLSARQGENQDRRHWEPQQEFLNRVANCPVWNEFIKTAGIAGRLRVGTPPERFCAVDFVRPGWDWIDPEKDAKADVMMIQAGLESPLEAIARRGRDPFKVLREVAQFKAWAKELGLELSVFAPPKPTPVQVPEKEELEDATEDEEEATDSATAAQAA